MTISGVPRRWIYVWILGAILLLVRGAVAQTVSAQTDGDRLRVTLKDFHLLTGTTLKQLKDGGSLIYTIQVSASGSRTGNLLSKTEHRFALSFDIFEERFQVMRLQPSRRVSSHLSQAAAEAACLEGFDLPIQSLVAAKQFWIHWDYRVEEPPSENDRDAKLGVLVEIFGRKITREPAHGSFEGGPFRLSDLQRADAPRGAGGR